MAKILIIWIVTVPQMNFKEKD